MVQKFQIFWLNLWADVIFVQCPFKKVRKGYQTIFNGLLNCFGEWGSLIYCSSTGTVSDSTLAFYFRLNLLYHIKKNFKLKFLLNEKKSSVLMTVWMRLIFVLFFLSIKGLFSVMFSFFFFKAVICTTRFTLIVWETEVPTQI